MFLTRVMLLMALLWGSVVVGQWAEGPSARASSGGFVALSAPARLLDTRGGASTIDGVAAGSGAVSSGSTTELTVAGRAGVPEGGDTVALNVAMVAPSDPGYATVWPCDATRPNASNVNFAVGQTIANVVLSRVSAAGTVCIFVETFTGVGTVELLTDVTGYTRPPTTEPPATTTPATTTPATTTPATSPATTTPATTTPATGGEWADAERGFRVPLTIVVGANDRAATSIDVDADLAAALAAAGGAGTADARSLRLVEVDAAGNVVDATVASQFDQSPGSPAGVGTIVVGVEGVTRAGSTRRYHAYFDRVGSGFTPVDTAAQVDVRTDVDSGRPSFFVSTPSAQWVYHRAGGGFSSLFDPAGNDWLSYSTAPGSAGSFRGIPNAVHPDKHFHPDSDTSVTTLVSSGPLKATIESVVAEGEWAVRWEIYPDRAHMSVLAAPRPYWFLYEGTPGGRIDPADRVVRPTGNPTPLFEEWSDRVQFVGFVDTAGRRSLVVLHHQVDDSIDSHRVMEGNMTVFGFGRDRLNKGLTGVSNTFTVALLATDDTAAVRGGALGLLASPTVGVGVPESRPQG